MGKGGNAIGIGASKNVEPARKLIPRPHESISSPARNADDSTDIPQRKQVSTKKSIVDDDGKRQRWYNQGGIQGISVIGMGINVALVPNLFATYLAPNESEDGSGPFFLGYSFPQVFLAVFCFHILSAWFYHGMRTVFCVVACSAYMTSLLALFTLDTPLVPAILTILFIAGFKISICMSTCLHRYSAHAAFKCGPTMQIFFNLLGCLANQGGPIWWASQHRCHHKYCDVPRDPHSAIVVGTERAFAFFAENHLSGIEEEFAPKHNDTWYLRWIDTFCFAVNTMETLLAYYFFGRDGMLISYISAWVCQTQTLWFNVANHPPNAKHDATNDNGSKKVVCKAVSERMRPEESFPLFHLLHCLHPFLGFFAGELDHLDHHNHPLLAKRDETDLAYFLFLLPLKTLGLIWNVKETRIV